MSMMYSFSLVLHICYLLIVFCIFHAFIFQTLLLMIVLYFTSVSLLLSVDHFVHKNMFESMNVHILS